MHLIIKVTSSLSVYNMWTYTRKKQKGCLQRLLHVTSWSKNCTCSSWNRRHPIWQCCIRMWKVFVSAL